MRIVRQLGVRHSVCWSHRYLVRNANGQQVADLGIPCQGLTSPGEILSTEKGYEAGLLAMAKALGHEGTTIECEEHEETSPQERTEL
jgi:hypothetical protein